MDHHAKIRAETIKRFNEENMPVLEGSDCDGNPIGVFHLGGEWHFGTKRKNGYHPFELITIPDVAVLAIREAKQKSG